MSAIVERLRAAIDTERFIRRGINVPKRFTPLAQASDATDRSLDAVAAEIDRLTRERDARPTEAEACAALDGAIYGSCLEQNHRDTHAIRELYRRKAEQP